MRLINKSNYPDDLLYDLLMSAAKSLGRSVRTGKVCVKVTERRYHMHTSGTAHNVCRVRGSWTGSRRWTTCDGAIKITMPSTRRGYKADELKSAEGSWNLMRHEWAHIADYQAGNMFTSKRVGRGYRRAKHDSRPVEIAAYNRVDAADARGRGTDIASEPILALALWIEEKQNQVTV